MAKVLFKRRTTAEIEELPVEDGALIYNTDNGKTYMDFEEERIQTGGNADTMIAIGGEEPTDEDIKIWFPDDTIKTKASEVVNSMEGNETDLSPSVNAVKSYINNQSFILWENENPTSNFEPQTINLVSADYDMFSIIFTGAIGENGQYQSNKILKGNATRMGYQADNDSGLYTYLRTVTDNGDMSMLFADAYEVRYNARTKKNDRCVPLYVIGYKTDLFKEVSE